ncbi:MAG: hydantoinase/oxoprolinase N-terminal domain-containing protein, partial [Henriciella sp.]
MRVKTGSYRLGVDVGGTNTDAVLMRGLELVASVKASTTPNVREGIVAAIKAVIFEAGIAPDEVFVVSIGTTHFTNAFVQRKGLDRVGVVRIALPAAQALPPFSGWPDDMAETLRAQTMMVRGGFQYDGRINSALDEDAVAQAARAFKSQGINAIALSALFSPVNDAMEQRACEIISTEHPDSIVTLSSHIGRIGLLERENAGIMNASLSSLARETVEGFRQALGDIGIRADFYISQNDGTLMNADLVEKYPVLTFAS